MRNHYILIMTNNRAQKSHEHQLKENMMRSFLIDLLGFTILEQFRVKFPCLMIGAFLSHLFK